MPKSVKKSKKTTSTPKRTSKEEKLFQNLLRITEQFMSGKSYRPLSKEQLMQRLALPTQHFPIFNDILDSLVDQGNIELSHGNYIWKQEKAALIQGVIHVHPRGFGFVRPDDNANYPEDIFIPKHLTLNAVDGDTVEILINTEVVSEKGPEGKVTAILSRSRTHVAGIIVEAGPWDDIQAHVPLLGSSHKVIVQTHAERTLKTGDRIVMEVVEWTHL
jgi:ribonuclease R